MGISGPNRSRIAVKSAGKKTREEKGPTEPMLCSKPLKFISRRFANEWIVNRLAVIATDLVFILDNITDVVYYENMAKTHPKITPEKLVEIRKLREKIDREEKDQIIAKGKAAFARHEKIKQTIARLKEARLAKQLTLEQVGERTGIGKANLSRLENEKAPNPTMDTVLRISEAIGCEVLR